MARLRLNDDSGRSNIATATMVHGEHEAGPSNADHVKPLMPFDVIIENVTRINGIPGKCYRSISNWDVFTYNNNVREDATRPDETPVDGLTDESDSTTQQVSSGQDATAGVDKIPRDGAPAKALNVTGSSHNNSATASMSIDGPVGKVQMEVNRCPVCNREFALRTNLGPHMLTHTGEKPFGCPICKRTFRQKVHLKKHIENLVCQRRIMRWVF